MAVLDGALLVIGNVRTSPGYGPSLGDCLMPLSRRARFAIPLLVGSVLLFGLFGLASAGAQPSCPPAPTSATVRLAVESRSDNALVADVTVVLGAAAPIYVEYGNAEAGWLRTPRTEPGLAHQVAIVRLRPQASYQVRAFALDAADCPTAVGAAELETGPLPAALQRLQIRTAGRASSPLVLTDISASIGRSGRWLTAFDQEGRLVWYYPIPERIRQATANHPANAVTRLSNGNLLYQTRSFGVEEITPDGRSVRVVEMDDSRIHHDVVQLEDGRVLFIGVEERVIDDTANGGPPIWRVWGDTLDILDLDTGAWRRAWSMFDAFEPFPRIPDRWRHLDRVEEDLPSIWEWSHANAIHFGRRGNLLLSVRHLDQVISLAPGFGTVEWRLGGPDSSFTFPDPADQFYGQHTASELPNGHILLFDNGNFRPEGPYSRALELELDFGTMTARKVWEYRHQPDVYAHRLSSAIRLPNGNTLIDFGFRGDGPDQPPVIVEARPDGTTAWELSARIPGGRTVSYRAYPWPTLGGELSVEPTSIAGAAQAGGR